MKKKSAIRKHDAGDDELCIITALAISESIEILLQHNFPTIKHERLRHLSASLTCVGISLDGLKEVQYCAILVNTHTHEASPMISRSCLHVGLFEKRAN